MHFADGIPSLFNWIPCCDHITGAIPTTVIDKMNRMVDEKNPLLFMSSTIWPLSWLTWLIASKSRDIRQIRCLRDELAKTTKQENTTQWNSALCCLMSVDNALPELTEILHARDRDLVSKVTKIDYRLLKGYITFLVSFQKATLALEVFAKPTLHRVLHFSQNLLKYFHIATSDINIMEKDSTITTLLKDTSAFAASKPKFC